MRRANFLLGAGRYLKGCAAYPIQLRGSRLPERLLAVPQFKDQYESARSRLEDLSSAKTALDNNASSLRYYP